MLPMPARPPRTRWAGFLLALLLVEVLNKLEGHRLSKKGLAPSCTDEAVERAGGVGHIEFRYRLGQERQHLFAGEKADPHSAGADKPVGPLRA